MKSMAAQMAVYAAYHRHPVNRAIHFVFVPAIAWSLMVALALVPLASLGELQFTVAHVATALLLAYYLALDFPLGVAATAVFTMLLVGALQVAEAGAATALAVAGVLFAASWIVQLLGHGVWEKRRPALADNLFQVFVAPIFLVAEAAFALGLRGPLRTEVHARMAPAGVGPDAAGRS